MFSKLLCALTLFLIMLVPLPGAAQSFDKGKEDVVQPPARRTWEVHNYCHKLIRLAVHYQKVDGKVVTRGWWSVPPQGVIKVQMISEWIGYLALSQPKEYYWSNPNGPKFGVDLSRDFLFPGDGTQQGVPNYGFQRISVIQEPITTLKCRSAMPHAR